MPTLTERRALAIEQAKGIALRAKNQQRGLTPSEMDQIKAKVDLADELKAQIADETKSTELFDQVMQLGAGGVHLRDGVGTLAERTPQFMDWSAAGRKNLAGRIAAQMIGTIDGQKALLPAGETTISVPVTPADPIAQGKVASNLLSVLPTVPIQAGAQARYVRQETRTNNAAAVAPGGVKPTSVYGLTPIDVALKVYAHLSEPTDRFLIEDAQSLATFLASELTYGLTVAVEGDVLNGAGGDAIKGMLQLSGIRTVAFDTDLLTTTRKAVTDAEKFGYASDLVFALSPDDWESIELSTSSGSGEFTLATAPVDRAQQRLWGVPVITVASLPDLTAALFDRPSVALYVDKQGVRVDWGSPADTWTKNQIVARCEGRFDLAVYQPAAVAKITTGAVGP